MGQTTIKVSGMSCGGCESSVEDALSALEGITQVQADEGADAVTVEHEGQLQIDAVAEAVADAGYQVEG